jgi:uncharacterized phiE125 gp8 family phage protein
MPLQLVTPPAEEPVSLAEAKQHLRVDGGDDDLLIGSLITAARQAAETKTDRQLITARWKLVLDAFPGPSLMQSATGASFSLPGHAILLAKCPVQSVVSIEYMDMNGATQVMPASDYVLDAACEPARLTPVFGKSWPPTLPQMGAVSVTHGEKRVRRAIDSLRKLRIGHAARVVDECEPGAATRREVAFNKSYCGVVVIGGHAGPRNFTHECRGALPAVYRELPCFSPLDRRSAVQVPTGRRRAG